MGEGIRGLWACEGLRGVLYLKVIMYEEIFVALDKAGVRYLVVGGVAVVLHGFMRATADLDLFVDLEDSNVKVFISEMKRLGFVPKAPVSLDDFGMTEKREAWRKEKGMAVFSVYRPSHPHELVDVFINEPTPFGAAFDRRKEISIESAKLSLISIPDLIGLKKAVGRPQDIEDIKALEELQ